MSELHWIESEDAFGLPAWERYIACGHWGLILTAVLPRWSYPGDWLLPLPTF